MPSHRPDAGAARSACPESRRDPLAFSRVEGGGLLKPPFGALIVAAHPDDEVIGLGGSMTCWRSAQFVHVTAGAPRDGRDAAAHGLSAPDYACVRRRELEQALHLAGIGPGQCTHLEFADQEVSLQLVALAQRLEALLAESDAEIVVTHPYEGGHPDHDATAFAVHAAVRRSHAARGRAPAIVEMTSYHNSPRGIEPGTFLSSGNSVYAPEQHAVVTRHLSPRERALKRRMFDCFETQRATLGYFPVDVERFRIAPRYDFSLPPHAGTLFYEQFEWGMTAARFCRLAQEALAELETGGVTCP